MQISVNLNNLKEVLQVLGKDLVQQEQAALASKKVDASGKLSRSLKSQVNINPNDVTLEITGEDYAKWVEHGSKGKPSPKTIRQWIEDKKLNMPEGVEYAIAKSIAKNGTLMYQGKGRYEKPISEVLSATPETIRKTMELLNNIELITITNI